jgi:hypothetical protein
VQQITEMAPEITAGRPAVGAALCGWRATRNVLPFPSHWSGHDAHSNPVVVPSPGDA